MRHLQPTLREADLQLHVCQYLQLQYPKVLFRSDYASGLKLTIAQAKRHKSLQAGPGWPDLMIYEPMSPWSGLAIELKRDGTRVYLRDGSLSTDPHLQEQAAVLAALRSRMWQAEFAVGFEAAKSIIDDYLGFTISK